MLLEAGGHARGFNGNHMYHPLVNSQICPDIYTDTYCVLETPNDRIKLLYSLGEVFC